MKLSKHASFLLISIQGSHRLSPSVSFSTNRGRVWIAPLGKCDSTSSYWRVDTLETKTTNTLTAFKNRGVCSRVEKIGHKNKLSHKKTLSSMCIDFPLRTKRACALTEYHGNILRCYHQSSFLGRVGVSLFIRQVSCKHIEFFLNVIYFSFPLKQQQ